MIFSRRRGTTGKHARPEERRRSGPRHAAGRPGLEEPEARDESASVESGDDLIDHGPGPYDVAEAPDGVPRLDLGSLQIPAIDGVEVRVQATPEGVVQQVVLVSGDSALQLRVLAAPRSEGIWDEVREEIRRSLVADGAVAEEVAGKYDTELRARVRTPDGPNDLRFLGIEGPRWMVQAVFQGAAAVDEAAAGPLADCLAGLVVDRGQEAMPVREGLPLRLPREMTEEQVPEGAGNGATPINGSAVEAPRRRGAGPGSARRKPPGRPRRR